MAYTTEEVRKAIDVLNKPSKHIQCVHRTENGMDFLHYSADLVRAFEVAVEVMEIELRNNGLLRGDK